MDGGATPGDLPDLHGLVICDGSQPQPLTYTGAFSHRDAPKLFQNVSGLKP